MKGLQITKYEKYSILGYILFALILSIILSILNLYGFIATFRAVLGLAYVLFLPGYIVVKLFYKENLDPLEQIGLSMGLSIALVILSVMFSNLLLRIPITTLTNFLVILAVIIITILIKIKTKQITQLGNKIKNKFKKKPQLRK